MAGPLLRAAAGHEGAQSLDSLSSHATFRDDGGLAHDERVRLIREGALAS
jgi:hypothetical protein